MATLVILFVAFVLWACPVLAAVGSAHQKGRRVWFAALLPLFTGWVGFIVLALYYRITPERDTRKVVLATAGEELKAGDAVRLGEDGKAYRA